MNLFKITTHLSEILEESEKNPVIIFKYSNQCESSDTLKTELEKNITNKKLKNSIYLLTVQEKPILSKKIAEFFNIKHESPQIIIISRGLVTYSASHFDIKINDFSYGIM
ncbi:MAG: hypothetical protein CEO12_48 [Parcubacteria group bacterium Gr01-1014_46]|nr:MAG: hypothetical protein CEO12_48 [Parcubacteria group bacterium Gr01-1014_46]